MSVLSPQFWYERYITLKKKQNVNFEMLANQILQCKERIIHCVQVGYFQKCNSGLTSEIQSV